MYPLCTTLHMESTSSVTKQTHSDPSMKSRLNDERWNFACEGSIDDSMKDTVTILSHVLFFQLAHKC